MIRIPISLPEEHHEYIRQQAFVEKCSMSDIVRRAVSAYVSEQGHEEMVKHIKLDMENDPNKVREELMRRRNGGKIG